MRVVTAASWLQAQIAADASGKLLESGVALPMWDNTRLDIQMNFLDHDNCSTIQSDERVSVLISTLVFDALTKWLANSRPRVLALAYSKSMTTNCLWTFAGKSSGDSPGGSWRRILPY